MNMFFQLSHKKLKKYEKEYMAMKEAQLQHEDPIERLEVSAGSNSFDACYLPFVTVLEDIDE